MGRWESVDLGAVSRSRRPVSGSRLLRGHRHVGSVRRRGLVPRCLSATARRTAGRNRNGDFNEKGGGPASYLRTKFDRFLAFIKSSIDTSNLDFAIQKNESFDRQNCWDYDQGDWPIPDDSPRPS